MSILLESLSQKSTSSGESVPDLSVTHFDDEMMGDDWLLQRLKYWKLFCLFLVLLLVASWVLFFNDFGQTDDSELRISKLEQQIEQLKNTTEQVQPSNQALQKQPALTNPSANLAQNKSVETRAKKRPAQPPMAVTGRAILEVPLPSKSISHSAASYLQN